MEEERMEVLEDIKEMNETKEETLDLPVVEENESETTDVTTKESDSGFMTGLLLGGAVVGVGYLAYKGFTKGRTFVKNKMKDYKEKHQKAKDVKTGEDVKVEMVHDDEEEDVHVVHEKFK